jgi:hypothetical protein
MRTEFAVQYSIPCVVIEPGDAFEDVRFRCYQDGAFQAGPEGELFCVRFHNRTPEYYTEDALRRSLPQPASREE